MKAWRRIKAAFVAACPACAKPAQARIVSRLHRAEPPQRSGASDELAENPRMTWLKLPLLWLFAVGLLAPVFGLGSRPALASDAAATTTVLRLDQAARVAADTPRFPAAASTQTVQLPDEWRRRELNSGPGPVSVWYRLVFDAPSAMLPQGSGAAELDPVNGLLAERACGQLTVYLNGHKLHADAQRLSPGGNLCYGSRLVALPAALMRERGNELDLRLVAYPIESVTARIRGGGLSSLQAGAYTELAERHERLRVVQLTSMQVSGLSLLVLGAFVSVIGWMNRRDSTFLYFGLMALAWAFVTLRAWWVGFSSGPLASQTVLAASVAPVAAAAVLFLLRYAGVRRRWMDAVLWAQVILMPLSLWWLSPTWAHDTALAWYLILGAQTIAAAGYCCWTVWQRDGSPGWPIVFLLAMGMALIALEVAAQLGGVGLQGSLFAHVGIALLIAAMAFRLVQGFVASLRQAERARISMEVRVAEATAEIERNFAQLAELRVEQVTEKERKRIAADLHDDLGAKLLTIVHTSESERISTLAREALEEMRLSVRGLTGKPVRIADALADWRAETVARLGQAGIDADWRSPTEELEQRLAARTYVQTTRILREAVSNIIKHSGATHCKVRCAIGTEDFVLTIQDNGRGISTEMSSKLDRGQGMYSMKNRAKQMQGQCLVESGPGYGTVIRLTLPLTERTLALPQP
jgi:two-component system, NarL family, sensor histidine kinase UhpB